MASWHYRLIHTLTGHKIFQDESAYRFRLWWFQVYFLAIANFVATYYLLFYVYSGLDPEFTIIHGMLEDYYKTQVHQILRRFSAEHLNMAFLFLCRIDTVPVIFGFQLVVRSFTILMIQFAMILAYAFVLIEHPEMVPDSLRFKPTCSVYWYLTGMAC